jgi:hypothetical protein
VPVTDHEFNGKGNFLFFQPFNKRVIEVTPDFQIVRTFGKITMLASNTHSVADRGLNPSYDAKLTITTASTPPFDHDPDADDKNW